MGLAILPLFAGKKRNSFLTDHAIFSQFYWRKEQVPYHNFQLSSFCGGRIILDSRVCLAICLKFAQWWESNCYFKLRLPFQSLWLTLLGKEFELCIYILKGRARYTWTEWSSWRAGEWFALFVFEEKLDVSIKSYFSRIGHNKTKWNNQDI